MNELYSQTRKDLIDCDSGLLNFYRANQISPVKQNIANLEVHYSRRRFLYQYLGVTPNCFHDREIIEFGPGSGHNALYNTSLHPKRYVLVDGNEVGLSECKQNFKQYFPHTQIHEFVHSRIEEFETTDRFDMVLCEGVIAHQAKPNLFLQHVASFVKKGGVVVISTSDYVSVLAEVLRRLISVKYVDLKAPLEKQWPILRKIFSPHLDSLRGMSRLYDDWIADNIVYQWEYNLFSIEDAILSLDDSYSILGSSPKFLTDWRWYKEVYGNEANINENTIHQYRQNLVNFIDYRVAHLLMSESDAQAIEEICKEIYSFMVTSTKEGSTRLYGQVARCCSSLHALIADISPITGESLLEVSAFFSQPPVDHTHVNDALPTFKTWFGRGQQYLSFVKL